MRGLEVADVVSMRCCCKGTAQGVSDAHLMGHQQMHHISRTFTLFVNLPAVLQKLVAEDAFWRDLAETKWGPAVVELKPQAVSEGETSMSWQSYCCKRMCLKSNRWDIAAAAAAQKRCMKMLRSFRDTF
jgi:hypothetical protein